jgi:signal transduction histidine kinase/ligand-binding sensor domain-containing protein/CheY-like chemotaxis protein/AraC-like DNA-binding protein
MYLLKINIFSIILTAIFLCDRLPAQSVFRFEHIGTEQGLSQNTGSSILFDSKGFMWIGTMNGLNRYDGYEFKIFSGQTGSTKNFINNRFTDIWEDNRGFIWAETYDGYYHFFNPRSEIFSTIPDYQLSAVRNFRMTSFLQYSEDIIFLGSSNGGIFILEYDDELATYRISQVTDKGQNSLSNNNVRFIYADRSRNIWIGTGRGVNFLSAGDLAKQKIYFHHLFVNATFTSVCESRNNIWFGTRELGILNYNGANGKFEHLNSKTRKLPVDPILFLYHSQRFHKIIVGFEGSVMITDSLGIQWDRVPFHGRELSEVYEDRHGQLWLIALEFGVTRFDVKQLKSTYYQLTPEEMKHLTDLERPQFFEDRYDNLWIGLHGGGLALYIRNSDVFQFFRNDPQNPNSISSNIIHSIAEDNSGQMWLGTGQFLGGIEKVILENPAFRHFLPEVDRIDMLDNVVRAIMEDHNRYVWVATKAGRLHIYDPSLKKVAIMDSLPGIGRESVRNNTYALFHDHSGNIWVGSKGDGLAVSTKPVKSKEDYHSIHFKRFKYSTTDTSTLGNNNIYSVGEDSSYNIWVATYGNGLSLMRNPQAQSAQFIRINQQNSNLTSNLVRNIHIDRQGNLWVATALGLNMLEKQKIDQGIYHFSTFLKDPGNKDGLSYNDIVQVFEDSRGRIWLGTFGGGVDLLEIKSDHSYTFRHFTSDEGLSNDVVFGILEDAEGNIWLSTEYGLTKLDPDNGSAYIYNTFNGLNFNNFSENTCFKRADNSLCFGGYLGFEVVVPHKLLPEKVKPRIELTSFLLFNKEVQVGTSSPLTKSISFTNRIVLKYNQSSFTIGFSSLDFLDPGKINYGYRLENFEEEWNNVGNQHRATYTNLSPGKYVFRVKSLLSDNISGSEERIIQIHIRAPWWKTLPAYISYLIIIIAVAVSIYKTAARLSRYRNELLVEKKVNELKLQFFTNISHEIRTPLTLIISPIEDILSTHGISARNRTLMEIIHKNARRMLSLTTQLLDFRKIQNNKMVLKITEIDLVSFTHDIYESFIPLARHKDIQYTFESYMTSINITADPSKLDTIIYNIISNAIKFTAQGKMVTVKIISAEEKFIDISVSDEGPGIPQKNLSDIFTRYSILSNHDYAGTGIGLSLSYELAKLHLGDIILSSVEGKGSTFTIRLPLGKPEYGENAILQPGVVSKPLIIKHQAEEAEDIKQDEFNGSLNESSKKHVILIVEDNQEILNYISESMRPYFTCIGAKNGEEGLHIARSMNPDLIITDIMMPGLNGMEMTRTLKQDFDTSHIPVIMLTSKVQMSDQIAGIEVGAEAYILKPFNFDYLRAVTNTLLSQRQKIMARFAGKNDVIVDTVKVATRDEAFLKKVVEFIDNNYENDFSIDKLAEYCCVGRTVFYNKIKGLTGFGPLEFVRKIKLKIASQLLDKGYNVSEVAYKTGFSDVKYFSRQFKAQYGHSPSKQNSKQD